jgi:gas vesicle protein
MRKLESNLLALLAGVAIGALAGVLLAPEKGEETRARIATRSRKFAKDIEEKSSELKNDIQKKSAELKKELEDQVEASKTKLNKVADSLIASAKEALENGTKKAEKPEKA